MQNRLSLIIKITSFALLTFLVPTILIYGQSVLAPIVVSALLAIAINPLVFKLEKLGLNRALSVVISLLAIFSVITVLLLALVFQFVGFVEEVPRLAADLINSLDEFKAFLQNKFNISPKSQLDYLIDHLKKYGFEAIGFIGIYIKNFILIFTKISIATLLVIFYTFFFLLYKNRFINFILLSSSIQADKNIIKDIIFKVSHIVSNYLLGKLIVIILLSIIQSAILYFLDIPFAFIWAALVSVLSLIPYIGVIIGSIIPIVIVSLIDFSIYNIIVIIITFSFAQFIEGYILTPYFIGSRVHINPLFILISLSIGNFIWGITGLALSIPILGILRVIFEHIKDLRHYAYLIGTEKMGKNKII